MTDRDPRYFDDVDDEELAAGEDDELPRRVPAERKKRVRMGQTVARLGQRATPPIGGSDLARTVTQRARMAKAQQLAAAGHNKGEKKGFGVTSNRTTSPTEAPPL